MVLVLLLARNFGEAAAWLKVPFVMVKILASIIFGRV
jgi:hypothetical protein